MKYITVLVAAFAVIDEIIIRYTILEWRTMMVPYIMIVFMVMLWWLHNQESKEN